MILLQLGMHFRICQDIPASDAIFERIPSPRVLVVVGVPARQHRNVSGATHATSLNVNTPIDASVVSKNVVILLNRVTASITGDFHSFSYSISGTKQGLCALCTLINYSISSNYLTS